MQYRVLKYIDVSLFETNRKFFQNHVFTHERKGGFIILFHIVLESLFVNAIISKTFAQLITKQSKPKENSVFCVYNIFKITIIHY